MMGRRTALTYLGAAAGTAMIAGYILDLLVSLTPLQLNIPSHHAHSEPILPTFFAITLILVLLAPTARKYIRRFHRAT
jgi:hypothetical protein